MRWISLALALILVLALGGCGTKIENTPLPIDEKAGGTNTPIKGGSINIAMPANPETLNPLEAKSYELNDLFSLIFDPLVRYDAKMRPVPGLAERWSVDETGKVWKFTLQKGAVFHDGKALGAADVVYTLTKLRDIYGDANRTSLYSGVIPMISSFSANEDGTVTIITKEASARILHWLNFPILQNNSLGSGSIPPGTGAYRVTNYEAGKQLTLTANEGWWRRTPYITTIVAKAMPDPDTALNSMDVKLVDVVHTTSLTAHSFKRQNVTNVYELMTQEIECIIPNMNNYMLADVRMRQAIIAALDRKTIITEAYLNHAVSIDVPITPDSYLYDTAHVQHTYSTGRAKDLLKEMGYADTNGDGIVEKNGSPLAFTIIVNQNTLSSARIAAARMAKEQLRVVGIDCEVKELGFTEFQAKLTAGTYDLAFAKFATTQDGDLRFLLHSIGLRNYGKYRDSALDALLTAFASAVNESDQIEKSADVQEYIAEKLPIISLYFRTNSLVSSASVFGITGTRDNCLYRYIEQWYKLKVGDETAQ
jgi:peptide/nickel transport system substrate-binding protein